ncbi:MAG: hypothetical protein EA353_14505 [Puniceicoccaceae bacterium]|nr:MAG: hypothetical protein EA353_14505 [Puniceicoccaceae bacterium]
MITPHRNNKSLEWETHWQPDPAYAYERRMVRTLRVAHSPNDTWQFTSDDGRPVTLYPDPGLDASGSFPDPGHFALLLGDSVEAFLFLDPAGADACPAGAIDGTSLGITPDSGRPVTEALNAALAKIAADGGGTLVLGPGRYETGTVQMQSSTYLHLAEGAVLQASLDLDAHPLDEPGTWPEDLPRSLIPGTRRRLISFRGVEDSGLLGTGVVCGNGSAMRHLYPGPRAMMQLIRAVDCRRLRFEGVTLRDSEFWSTHIVLSEDVSFIGVKVLNEIPPPGWDSFLRPDSKSVWNNADGINPDSSQRVTIERCFFHTGDDCVPIKNTGCHHNRLTDVADITVRNCLMCTPTTAMKIGTETRGERIGRILFEDIHIVEASRIIGLDLKDGAEAHDVTFRRIHARRCNRPLDIWVIAREGQVDQTRFSSIRDIALEDVCIELSGIEGGNQTSHISGRDATFDVCRVKVRDLAIDGCAVRTPSDMALELNEWVSDLSWS